MRSACWEGTIELSEDGCEYTLVEEAAQSDMSDDEQRRQVESGILAEMSKATVGEFAARIKKSDQTARRRLNELVD